MWFRYIVLYVSLYLSGALNAFSQTAQQHYSECINALQTEQAKEEDAEEGKWFEDAPNPSVVMTACADHVPRFWCIRHRRQCGNSDPCTGDYENALTRIRAKYETRRDACTEAFKQETAREDDRQRKALEEKRRQEAEEAQQKEKERLKKEANSKKTAEDRNKIKERQDNKERNDSVRFFQESDEMRARRMRMENQRARDHAEDEAMQGAMSSAGEGMGLLSHINVGQDNLEDAALHHYLKAFLGIGISQVPMTQNLLYDGKRDVSNVSSSNCWSINGGFMLSLFNDAFVNVKLTPFFSYGTNAFQDNITGSYTMFGSAGNIGLGGKFRFLLAGEYVRRSGNNTYDELNPFYNLDVTGYASYNYVAMKYGAGFFIDLGSHDTYLQLIGYRENLSFLKGRNAEIYSCEAKFSFIRMTMSIQYGKNYPVAGDIKNKSAYEAGQDNLLILNLSVPATILSVD